MAASKKQRVEDVAEDMEEYDEDVDENDEDDEGSDDDSEEPMNEVLNVKQCGKPICLPKATCFRICVFGWIFIF